MQKYAELGEGAVDQEPMVYRRARARESLLLCMHLHGSWSDTLSLHEALAQLMAKAPPDQLASSFETAFTTIFIWFVKDYVLPRWEMLVPTQPGTEKGSAADRAYVESAKSGGLPLVTNEGFTPSGIVDQGLRKRAKTAGVPVFTPREFYDGKINEAVEIGGFLTRFRDQAPRYLAAHWERIGKKDKSDELLTLVFGVYRHVLLGETEGRSTPVRVSM